MSKQVLLVYKGTLSVAVLPQIGRAFVRDEPVEVSEEIARDLVKGDASQWEIVTSSTKKAPKGGD